MTDDDPVPEAVRSAGRTHVHTLPEGYLGNDYSQTALANEAAERAFWAGMRQVVREEVAAALSPGLAHVAGDPQSGAAYPCYCPIGRSHP